MVTECIQRLNYMRENLKNLPQHLIDNLVDEVIVEYQQKQTLPFTISTEFQCIDEANLYQAALILPNHNWQRWSPQEVRPDNFKGKRPSLSDTLAIVKRTWLKTILEDCDNFSDLENLLRQNDLEITFLGTNSVSVRVFEQTNDIENRIKFE